MTKQVRCPDCQGNGEIEIEGTKKTCLFCGGKGYTIGSGRQVRCTPCKGTGKRGLFKTCTTCEGRGYIIV